jgi:ribosomal protein S18 acetylase RimI-like enzyme
MASKYRIVPADLTDPEHCAGLVHCLDQYAADPMGRGEGLPLDVQQAIVPGLLQHPERLIRLALHERTVVGAAVCFVGFSTFSAKPRINVHDLCVLRPHRGLGVGRALLDSVLAAGRELGCSGVTLEVRTDNEVAQKLYRSLGFSSGTDPMWFWARKLP